MGNRLTEVKKNTVTIGSYAYDANGMRAKKVEGGATTHYLALGHQVMYEKTGVEHTRHIFAGNQRIAEVRGAVVSYSHNDHLGSPRVVTDANGVVTSTMSTKPFGEPHAGSIPTSYGFTGKDLDDTGLYYFAARYYDASVGRFITEDNWVGRLSTPASQNRYVYVVNNPLKYVDPTGNTYSDPLLDAGGAAGILLGKSAPWFWDLLVDIGHGIIEGVSALASGVAQTVMHNAAAIVDAFSGESNNVRRGRSGSGGNSASPDPNDLEKYINPEKQARHLAESVKGTRSYLNPEVNAQQLLNEFGGKGHVHGHKEVIDCGRIVGYWVDINTGIAHATTRITIHYSTTGAHIIPAIPNAMP